MSKMSVLFIDIQEKLQEGIDPVKISKDLQVPLYFVDQLSNEYYFDKIIPTDYIKDNQFDIKVWGL